MVRPTIVLALLVAIVAGCHQQQPSDSILSGGRPNVITRDQIDSTGYGNVYDVIARLHAEFLRDRGVSSIKLNVRDRATVFLNDVEYGIPETLRNFPTADVEEVRYFSGPEASAKFGPQYGGGVIQLISRTQ